MKPFFNSIILYFLSFVSLSPCLYSQWEKQNFPTEEDLYKVRFANEMVGWILGDDYIYKTTDGGINWTPEDSRLGYGEALYVLNDQTVFYSDASNIILNERGIRRTTDGGLNWETVDFLPFIYYDFEFTNDSIGFVVGIDENRTTNTVRITKDGGATWSTLSTDFLQTGYELEGVTFVNDLEGWAVSDDGYVYHTTDGAVHWTLQDSLRYGYEGYLLSLPVRDIFFTTPDSGWAVGGISGFMLIARTTDGGNNWIVDVSDTGSSLREVYFVNSNIGWFVGAFNSSIFIAKTTNGGINWEQQDLIPVAATGMNSICMINENIGWVVGYYGLVYKTTNRGVTAVEENLKNNALPDEFTLRQNFPNPFNPTTTIYYSVPKESKVTIVIFDNLGKEVKTLVDDYKAPGQYTIKFDASELASGIYFYQMKTKNFVSTRKAVYLR